MTPSSSTYTYSFGFHSTCPNCNKIFRSPFPSFTLLFGIVPNAKIPIFIFFSSLESRTYPYTIIPASFLSSAIAAKLSPSNAQFVDAPPSTTNTVPSGNVCNPSFTSTLSSFTFTVAIFP
ncbi:Uncharacterised protein [Streptococcus pneumoniae]|nr:Uncharacterised protein [Streptococcus pneumoniae]